MRIDQVQKLCEQWHLSSQLSAGSELNSIACTTIKYTKPYPWRDTPSFTTYRFQQWPRTAGERYKFFSIYLFIFFCSIFFFSATAHSNPYTILVHTHTHTLRIILYKLRRGDSIIRENSSPPADRRASVCAKGWRKHLWNATQFHVSLPM